jgi:hypothetical protein
MYRVTGGVPRLVNLVSGRAVALGYEASADTITAAMVLAAASDAGLSPPPRTKRMARAAVVLLTLVAAGAAAAWAFRDEVTRLIRNL